MNIKNNSFGQAAEIICLYKILKKLHTFLQWIPGLDLTSSRIDHSFDGIIKLPEYDLNCYFQECNHAIPTNLCHN